MLDVSSNTQGVLVPRMDSAHRATISSPATGLLVYQTNGLTPGFYFYTGSAWTSLNSYTNVTTQGNNFNGANKLVQANSSASLSKLRIYAQQSWFGEAHQDSSIYLYVLIPQFYTLLSITKKGRPRKGQPHISSHST